jgi:3-dehydroquinate dehydratase type I
MTETRIAVAVTDSQADNLKRREPEVDLWELRLDLMGAGWPETARQLTKPWIACNRSRLEGGRGEMDETLRLTELLAGLDSGAAIVDIELSSPAILEIVPGIKRRAECLVSYHNFIETPELSVLNEILQRQLGAGADICKIVTTAHDLKDNLVLLKLIMQNPEVRLVAFAMGSEGRLSRLLSPLAGAYFTFASLERGKESAPGQLTLAEMREIYRLIGAGY